nr:MAG TPA: hypothetical protein [Caudoviricetes sp.]
MRNIKYSHLLAFKRDFFLLLINVKKRLLSPNI